MERVIDGYAVLLRFKDAELTSLSIHGTIKNMHRRASGNLTKWLFFILFGLLAVSLSLNVWLFVQMNSGGYLFRKGLSVVPKCLRNGFLSKEEFLPHYRVGEAETLQSVAQNQLHDQSRAYEIYLLNSVQLPGFNETTILPHNITLLLPPIEASFSSANVLGIDGRIMKLQGDVFFISPKRGLTIDLYSTSKTKLERNFKIGDCVEAIYYGDSSNKAIWISPQT